jgi:hypothetical protein
MKTNDFYEVNGCNWFIPVDLIKENKCTKELEVVATESGRTTFVPTIYKFPKPQEPQKPVVPQFVAEWIEECKSEGVYLCTAMSNDKSKTFYWLDTKEKQDIFARAWLDGYEVETEKLYTVEIPNQNLNAHTVLQKTEKGIVLISVTNARWRGWESSKLTEAEIKQDFDFLWQWAKEVE